MTLTLDNVQMTLKAALETDPVLAGVTILIEDGVAENDEPAKAAIASDGIVLIIQRVFFGNVVNQITEYASTECLLPVLIQEAVQKNRSPAGTGERIERLVQRMIAAVLGYPRDRPPPRRFSLFPEAIINRGNSKGLEEYVINFNARIHFTQTPE